MRRREPESVEARYDALVVGGGAAGMSAALVLGRARRRTLLADGERQSNRVAHRVGGGLALDGTAPADLYARGHRQLGSYGSVATRCEQVVELRRGIEGFCARFAGGEQVSARAVVMATGMDYEIPDVPGFAELWGDAVFHCPFCHGWEVRDRRVAVLGPPGVSERLATLIGAWTDDVKIVDPAGVVGVRADEGVLRALVCRDGSEVACGAVLVHATLKRRDDLAEQLGLDLTDDGFVRVDPQARTSVPGVYAAGDLAYAPQQVAVAIGSGHTAGLVATRELLLGHGS